MLPLADKMRALPGNVLYRFLHDARDPQARYITEIWETEQDHEYHLVDPAHVEMPFGLGPGHGGGQDLVLDPGSPLRCRQPSTYPCIRCRKVAGRGYGTVLQRGQPRMAAASLMANFTITPKDVLLQRGRPGAAAAGQIEIAGSIGHTVQSEAGKSTDRVTGSRQCRCARGVWPASGGLAIEVGHAAVPWLARQGAGSAPYRGGEADRGCLPRPLPEALDHRPAVQRDYLCPGRAVGRRPGGRPERPLRVPSSSRPICTSKSCASDVIPEERGPPRLVPWSPRRVPGAPCSPGAVARGGAGRRR
jgi:antibiotic biosynthesis monooxygenase